MARQIQAAPLPCRAAAKKAKGPLREAATPPPNLSQKQILLVTLDFMAVLGSASSSPQMMK